MIKNLSKPLLLLFLLFSVTSQALPILQADAFTEGDNEAALEIDTGLIWMDFGVNSHRPYSDIVASLSSDYVGWRLPNTLEVKHLWLGIFGGLPEWQPWNIMHSMDHDAYFNQVSNVLGTNGDGYNSEGDGNGNYEEWLVKTMFGVFESSPGTFGFIAAWIPYDEIHTNDAMFLEAVGNLDTNWYGALLVKDNVAVPEPGALSLLLLGLLGVAIKRIRKN